MCKRAKRPKLLEKHRSLHWVLCWTDSHWFLVLLSNLNCLDEIRFNNLCSPIITGTLGLISSIWVLNFINIFIHPWWAPAAAGAIPSTSPALWKVGSHPFKCILNAAPPSPSWGHVGRWNQAFHLHRLWFHRHRWKIICREPFWGLKPIKINVSVHALDDNHTRTCCLQENPVEPVCTVNTDSLWFCASDLCHHAITTEASHYSPFLFVFIFPLIKSSWRPSALPATRCVHVIYCRSLPLLSLSLFCVFFFFFLRSGTIRPPIVQRAL